MKAKILFILLAAGAGWLFALPASGAPACSPSNILDTVTITWYASLTGAIPNGEFSFGDTLVVRYAFDSNPDPPLPEIQLQRIGLSFLYGEPVRVIVSPGQTIYYRYYVVHGGVYNNELQFCPHDRTCYRRFTLTAGAGQANIYDTSGTCPVCDRRMPRFLNTRQLSRLIVVRWELDLRPAWYQVAAGDTLHDLSGIFSITNRDSVMTSGVWINGPATGGWQTWGIALQQDASRRMYDDGTHGDRVAGDSVFTRVTIATPDSYGVGTLGQVGQVFKYSIKGGDNEAGPEGYDIDHYANIIDSGTQYTIFEQWGSNTPSFYRCWDYDNRGPRPCITAVVLTPAVPRKFMLYQNYPNPFNPSTTIRFSVPPSAFGNPSPVRLSVFDLLGREAAVLANESKPPGIYQVQFDGSKLPSGVYFYRLEAGNYVAVKKLVIIR